MVDDHILVLKQFVPKNECEKLIKNFESSPEKEDGKFGLSLTDYSIKKCTELWYSFYCEEKDRNCVNEYLPLAFKKYNEKYSLHKTLDPLCVADFFKVQKYLPFEGFFNLHCENVRYNSVRVLAWMIYLNDVTDGGYTEFPHQEKKFQPRVGDLLIWPAYFTHKHRGIISKTQTKYIATGWFEYFDEIKVPNISYV